MMPEENMLILAYGAYIVWKKLPCRVQAQILEVGLRALAQALKDQAGKEKKRRRPLKKRPHNPEDF